MSALPSSKRSLDGEDEEDAEDEEGGFEVGLGASERARLMALMAFRRCVMAASAREGSLLAINSEAE